MDFGVGEMGSELLFERDDYILLQTGQVNKYNTSIFEFILYGPSVIIAQSDQSCRIYYK